jgi:hypothetical protein
MSQVKVYRIAVYSCIVDDAPEITVLQLPKFKAEATELIGTGGIEAVAAYLIDHPDAGDVIPGAGGARKLRWAAKGKGKRGGARIVYLYIVIAASCLPAPLLCEKCQNGSDGGREETTAANRGSSEGSAIACQGNRSRRRRPSERT